MENMTLVDFLNSLNLNSTGSGYDINRTNKAVGEVFKHIEDLKDKLESALASSDDYQDRWMQATAKLEAIESNKVAEFSEPCCSQCFSPRMEHNISDLNLSECNNCGHTTSGKDLGFYTVTISKDKQ